MKSILDAQISSGTRVFVRLDLDVPIEDNNIENTFRLDKALKTLNYIIEKGGIPVIAGHIGRPKGSQDPALSTNILKNYFDEKLGIENYELLENLRFNPGEEKNSKEFASKLSQKAEIYINESFATCHREHASMVGVPKILPAFAGFRLEEEVRNLSKIAGSADKPFVAIIAGIKLESKKPAINKFVEIADQVLVGGTLGLSWNEETPSNLHLPTDYATDNKDIGPQTIETYKKILSKAKTVLWAGPVGMWENEKFATGTQEIAKAVVATDSFKVAGGGDTVAALTALGFIDQFSFVSTGGGAMLKFLVDETLPALEVLNG